jgi:hypothetical protein
LDDWPPDLLDGDEEEHAASVMESATVVTPRKRAFRSFLGPICLLSGSVLIGSL